MLGVGKHASEMRLGLGQFNAYHCDKFIDSDRRQRERGRFFGGQFRNQRRHDQFGCNRQWRCWRKRNGNGWSGRLGFKLGKFQREGFG